MPFRDQPTVVTAYAPKTMMTNRFAFGKYCMSDLRTRSTSLAGKTGLGTEITGSSVTTGGLHNTRCTSIIWICLPLRFPDWEIVVAIDLSDKGHSWPNMGLTIRAHEIIDELQRQYFPPQYQGIKYEGARLAH
jgi:hypothetical protein